MTTTSKNASYGYNSNSGNLYQGGLANSKLYQNSGYSSGEISPSQYPQYMFKERNGRLKWKEIMKLDLEAMIRSNDLSPIENYLENLIFSSVDENDLQIVPETSLLKLVKVYQHVLEYLLFSQQRLENENKILDTNYSQLFNDATVKEAQLKENKNLITTLKKDKKQKEMVLNTYKCLVDEYKNGQICNNSNNLNSQNEIISKSTKKYFYCKICEGKKFSSEENLEAHMQRRHQTNEDFHKGKDSEVKIDNKLDEMKTFFETYIKNFQNESYLKIYENQKVLENKLTEIKYEKSSDLKEMENHFKNTLVEMKEIYLKNSITAIGNSYLPPQSKREPEDDSEKVSKKLKKETKKMNELLKEINKEQNEKIGEIMKQLNTFKETITEEFKEIKVKDKTEKIPKVEVTPKTIMPSERELKVFTPAVDHVVTVEYTTPQKKQKELIRDSIVQKSIKQTKLHFNSGPLESDEESDNERVLKNQSVNIKEIGSSQYGQDSQDVKFSFAPSSLKMVLTKESGNSFAKQEDDTRVKNSIVENIEKDMIKISTRPENGDSPTKKRMTREEDIEEIVNKGEPEPKPKQLVEEIKKPIVIKKVEEKKAEPVVEKVEEKKPEPVVETKPEPVVEKKKPKPVEGEDKIEIIPIEENHPENKTQEATLNTIKKFYHSFIERDNNAVGVDKPVSDTLTVKIIPQKPSELIDIKLTTLLDTASKQTSRKGTPFENISSSPNEEVLGMIDNILKNIQNLSDQREFFEVYYANISSVIGLEDCLNFVTNKKANKSVYPVSNPKGNVNANIKAKIINKDEFSLPSPDNNFAAANKTSVVDDQVRITDDDDQFEHDDL